MFLVNSRHPLFTATPKGSGSKFHHPSEHTFSRSYGASLLSSLTRVISSALGFSPRPPVSVCGTVTRQTPYEAFLGSVGSASSPGKPGSPSPLEVNDSTDLPMESLYRFRPGIPSPGWHTLLRPPFGVAFTWWYRNINLFPISYAFRPRLRGRLTLRGLPLLRKPWAYGDRVFHPVYRYSCQHTLFCLLQCPSRVHLHRLAECSPTIRRGGPRRIHSFGNVLKPRYIFGADPLDQ